jgi:hypothetical protein
LEKFRSTQEKARKRNQMMLRGTDSDLGGGPLTRSMLEEGENGRGWGKGEKVLPEIPARVGSKMDGGGGVGGGGKGDRPASAQSGTFGVGGAPPRPGTYGVTAGGGATGAGASGVGTQPGHKSRSSLGNFGKFASGIGTGRHKAKK